MTIFTSFKPHAIIFDKDGTLIDFDTMWGGWTLHLAAQIEQASGCNIRERLCAALGYDEEKHKVLPNGKLASRPMSDLFDLTLDVLLAHGLNRNDAARYVEQAWCIPDPVILARPFTDLRQLFTSLQVQGIQIAIATADDRAPTQAFIEAFDLEEYISAMVCADDGFPSKPEPDMVLELCRSMNVDPSKVIVIGDTVSDLRMAKAAQAGLAVGVLSGVSSSRDLVTHADLLIESVDEIHTQIEDMLAREQQNKNSGLNPDFAF